MDEQQQMTMQSPNSGIQQQAAPSTPPNPTNPTPNPSPKASRPPFLTIGAILAVIIILAIVALMLVHQGPANSPIAKTSATTVQNTTLTTTITKTGVLASNTSCPCLSKQGIATLINDGSSAQANYTSKQNAVTEDSALPISLQQSITTSWSADYAPQNSFLLGGLQEQIIQSTNASGLYAYELNTSKSEAPSNLTYNHGTTASGMSYAAWNRTITNSTGTMTNIFILAYKGNYAVMAIVETHNSGVSPVSAFVSAVESSLSNPIPITTTTATTTVYTTSIPTTTRTTTITPINVCSINGSPLLAYDTNANPQAYLILVGNGYNNTLSAQLEAAYNLTSQISPSETQPISTAYGDRILLAGYSDNQTYEAIIQFDNEINAIESTTTKGHMIEIQNVPIINSQGLPAVQVVIGSKASAQVVTAAEGLQGLIASVSAGTCTYSS